MASEPRDHSAGWNAMAAEFIVRRNPVIGVATVRKWAASLPAGASVLDLGCGHGVPISAALAGDGFAVYGVDASPDLAAEFKRRVPQGTVVCEAVEESTFFGLQFDAAVAIGLVFLLPADTQRHLIHRISAALHPGARFLFTAPTQCTTWPDLLTGRRSISLGEATYSAVLLEAGFELVGEYTDEGENHYYSARKSGTAGP